MAESWEVVAVLGNEEEARLIAGFLAGHGIACEVESVHSHEFPITVNPLGEVRLQVPGEHAERARALIAEHSSAELAEGWSEPPGPAEE
ncbi:MAG TPA: hypothetical protein VMT16_03630 [Thermoanaerobaculia bacterium]|nr:hypothetical protein [Thermoanaerobaculia bacterium]